MEHFFTALSTYGENVKNTGVMFTALSIYGENIKKTLEFCSPLSHSMVRI